MQFPGRSPSVGDGHAQSPTMGLSHCRCQDQWTARTLWTAKAAREAETNLCKRRSSAPPTASASGTFSMAADTRGQFHEWSKEQYVVRNSRCPWKLLPNNTPTLTRELSALSTSQTSRNEKVPESLCQLSTQVPRSMELPLEQRLLEPAVEVRHAAVELRLPVRDEHGADAEPQAEPDHSRQGARRRPPAGQRAGVVELDLRRSAQVLPAFTQEPEDLVHAAGGGQTQADGAVEGVLAHPDGVAVALPREVDRPSEIHLMELVGGPGLRAGVFFTRQQWGKADPRRGQAVALQDTLDGASAGQRADVQGLEFGEDGVGPDQAVAGSWRGMRLKPPTDGEDGALQFGRDALGDLVVGPGEVVEALGTGLEIAAPPLVGPELGAAQSRADRLDRATAESESDGALACGEFVPHGYLRGAAAGGCPRRSLYRESEK